MAAQKSQDSINLLPQKGFESTTRGRVLAWILSTFRILVIATELIVMIAFLSRLWIDAQNTDLKEDIERKKAVLVAYQSVEKNFKDAQKKLEVFSGMTKNEGLLSKSLDSIRVLLPEDVFLVSVDYSNKGISVEGASSNEKSIQQYIVTLKSSQTLKDISLTSLATDEENPQLLIFKVSGVINQI